MALTLQEIVQKSPKRATNPPRYLIGMDPGGTTGWCLVDSLDCSLVHSGQFRSSFIELRQMFEDIYDMTDTDDIVAVVESYRLYPWKLQDQTWSSLYTPRFIGAIEYSLYIEGIPIIFQSAQQGKSFVTNQRLKEWGFYKSSINGVSQKHANDACRHPASYLIFGRDMQPELMEGNAE